MPASPTPPTLDALRRHAVARAFPVEEGGAPGSIEQAVRRLGFVQADPIRAPARAQDLILRLRVPSYRAGDLEREYPRLALSEERLHVHGFLPDEHRPLLYPRPLRGEWPPALARHRRLRPAVLRFVREHGPAHPREVERAVGSETAVNAWGGQSSASTLLLELLHWTGHLRVARRVAGQRIYEVAPAPSRSLKPMERAEGIARLIARLYSPMPERSLRQALGMVTGPVGAHPREGLARLIARGELRREIVAGEAWIRPADEPLIGETAAPRVRLLAPFDPVVWDRRRFERLWGWEYRFEAYTPVGQRKLGYYALPLLYGDRVIGWANLTARADGLEVTLGFAGPRPRGRPFRASLDEEIDRMRVFLAQP